MQESRLFKIVYYLLEKGQATAHELAEKFEVSDRTIYRDIDALSAAGIPVYTEAGRTGGVRLLGSFVLDRTVLSEAEKHEILAALQSIGGTVGVQDRDTLNKLSALFDVSTESWLEVDFSRWGGEGSDNEKFERLKTAVIHRRSVRITYANANGSISSRVVHPLKLSYKSRAWYLKAFCVEKQDYRTFKLTRILELEMLEDQFSPYPPPPKTDFSQFDNKKIVLRFPEELAYRIYDEFNLETVKREDGVLIVTVWMPVDEWLTRYLLTFGTEIEVLEPPELRPMLAELGKAIYEKYRD